MAVQVQHVHSVVYYVVMAVHMYTVYCTTVVMAVQVQHVHSVVDYCSYGCTGATCTQCSTTVLVATCIHNSLVKCHFDKRSWVANVHM